MTASINSVTVFPSSAVTLFIADSFTCVQGVGPTFYYELRDNAGASLKNGYFTMTTPQWNAWSNSVSDTAYITGCAATNLGLTLS